MKPDPKRESKNAHICKAIIYNKYIWSAKCLL